jgi:hypothetical protein
LGWNGETPRKPIETKRDKKMKPVDNSQDGQTVMENDPALRRLFDAYSDPLHEFWGLTDVLGSIQKAYGGDWMHLVNDVMLAMEVHDAGGFPDSWLEELDGGAA